MRPEQSVVALETSSDTVACGHTAGMSTIVELQVPAEEFALAHTFEQVSDVIFEAERIVADPDNRITPFVWALSETPVEEALAADPSVANVTHLSTRNAERLYQMDWTDDISLLLHLLREQEGTILSARASHDNWQFRVHVPERERLEGMLDFCRDNELTIEIEGIYEMGGARDAEVGRHALTDDQHEVLRLATKHGYYEVPRQSTAADLADALGIAESTFSERIRRAHGALNRSVFVLSDDD
jgi:predicted DNA binding protein